MYFDKGLFDPQLVKQFQQLSKTQSLQTNEIYKKYNLTENDAEEKERDNPELKALMAKHE